MTSILASFEELSSYNGLLHPNKPIIEQIRIKAKTIFFINTPKNK
jgi:hypothetical protein